MGKPVIIEFRTERIKRYFEDLQKGDEMDRILYKHISRAIQEISENPRCGTPLSHKLWKKPYKKYDLETLWKYDLPMGWRLMYSLKDNTIKIVCIIVEWFSHKEYEKKFNYTVRESYPHLSATETF